MADLPVSDGVECGGEMEEALIQISFLIHAGSVLPKYNVKARFPRAPPLVLPKLPFFWLKDLPMLPFVRHENSLSYAVVKTILYVLKFEL